MSEEMNSLFRAGTVSVVFQALAIVAVLLYNHLVFMDYLHVLSAAMWVGGNVFMGIIFYRLIRTLPQGDQVDISRRLLPLTLFFLPSISVTTIITGVDLLSRLAAFVPLGIRLAVYSLAGVLLIISLLGLLPNSLYIYRGFNKSTYDAGFIIRKSLSNFRLCLIQSIIQVMMIGVMAYIVVVLIP